MNIDDLIKELDEKAIGEEIYSLIEELFPICRSITGDGLRETLGILQKHIPLKMHEVPTGTEVFDWTVPKEWNIKDAYVKNSKGERIIDFRKSNLHILNYSIPIHNTVSLSELKDHIYTIPEHPDWIPYKTSYYSENWGFCLSHNDMLKLKDDDYEVFIDSSLEDGHLSYGEYYLKGQAEEEVLISTHVCHPSLANDNLSGVGLSTILAKYLSTIQTRYTYRFIFIPGTIGAITWLWRNEESVSRIRHGLVISGVGDSGSISYKRSRRGDAEIDRATEHVLKKSGEEFQLFDFDPYGYDERQYCSPGFNLSVGRISRTPFGQYPQYHTSVDNLNFVKPKFLANTFNKITDVLFILENNRTFVNQNPKCEPQLGKRGLYKSAGTNEIAMLWVLNLSDGQHSLLDITERSGIEFQKIRRAASTLTATGLLIEA
jgi:aminopeptidase-like protein